MLAQVLAGTLGPLVPDAHRLRRRRVVVVQLVEDLLPVLGPAQLAGAAREVLASSSYAARPRSRSSRASKPRSSFSRSSAV